MIISRKPKGMYACAQAQPSSNKKNRLLLDLVFLRETIVTFMESDDKKENETKRHTYPLVRVIVCKIHISLAKRKYA